MMTYSTACELLGFTTPKSPKQNAELAKTRLSTMANAPLRYKVACSVLIKAASQVNLADCMSFDTETIRYSSDASVNMVWADGEPVRCPSQHDMDTLPVGSDMDDDELAQCE